MKINILSLVLPLGFALLAGLSVATYAAQSVEGKMDSPSSYYEIQQPRATIDVQSVIPPPTSSDMKSEGINRTNTPHLDRYIEKRQAVPTATGRHQE
jgi:hypothetical protein